MNDITNQGTSAKRVLNLPKMPKPVRIILAILVILAGLYALLNALIIGLSTFLLRYAFINGFLTAPWLTGMMLFCYLASVVALAIMTELLFRLAYCIIKGKALRLSRVIIGVACLAIFLFCFLVVLPLIMGK